MSSDDRKLNKIEELKTKLFSVNYKPKIEHYNNFVHKSRKEISDSWNTNVEIVSNKGGEFLMKTNFFKKFFVFSLIFLMLAIGYASYVFLVGGNTVSNKNIEISILGNTFAAGGEELPLQIEIINKNNSPLQLADLLIEYPKGSSQNTNTLNERMRESLGTISSGSVRNENIKVVLYGEEGSTREIKVSLEYRVEGSNAIFIKEKVHRVSISSSPLSLYMNIPEQVSPNQEIAIDIKTILNATNPANKILVKMDYPVGFQFISANPKPSFGDNVWNLGDLTPGSDRDIQVIGKMVDVFDGEEKTFHLFSGSQDDSDKTEIGLIYNSLGKTVAIEKPFIEAKLYVNGVYGREYTTESKNAVQAEIRWVNNLDTKINDMVIVASLGGNSLNKSSVNAQQGFFNSSQNTIIWDKNFQNKFASVNPGDSGSVSFSFSSLPLFSGGSDIRSLPVMEVSVSISGKQAESGNEIKSLENSETKTIKIISDLNLASKVLYSTGSFTNTGPVPPKVDTETTYTVVWSLSNTSNNISNAVATSSLPIFSRFIATSSPDLVYNPSTKEITWNIGKIPSGIGINGEEKEVSFQIGFLPSLSQLNSSPFIINNVILTGHDDFANVDVRLNKPALTARLSNESSSSVSERVVQ